MIIDQSIDELTAKYFCIFAKMDFKKLKKDYVELYNSDSNEKKAMQFVAKTAAKKTAKTESLLEGIFDSTPAWVEEPTGFNLASPNEVFKGDVAGGIAGFNKGAKAAAIAGGVATAASLNPVAALAAMKTGGKMVGKAASLSAKHPVAAGVAGYIGFNELFSNEDSWYNKIKGAMGNLLSFVIKNPTMSTAIGTLFYGLVKTWPLWFPYIRRAAYELSHGKAIACCEFTSNGQDYKLEYTLSKNKWVLLSQGKIASSEDAASLVKTKFYMKFVNQCKKYIQTAFDNMNFIEAARLTNVDELGSLKLLMKNKEQIEANMFTGKILF